MSKVAVVYWSSTGNTEAMASSVQKGAEEKGAESKLFTCAEFSSDMMDDFDVVAFGCPAMGEEELEEDEFKPLFDSCKDKISGKKIALFGSYEWGDGEWMRTWEENCRESGANLVHDSVICCETPGPEAVTECETLGAALAQA